MVVGKILHHVETGVIAIYAALGVATIARHRTGTEHPGAPRPASTCARTSTASRASTSPASTASIPSPSRRSSPRLASIRAAFPPRSTSPPGSPSARTTASPAAWSSTPRAAKSSAASAPPCGAPRNPPPTVAPPSARPARPGQGHHGHRAQARAHLLPHVEVARAASPAQSRPLRNQVPRAHPRVAAQTRRRARLRTRALTGS